MQSALSDQQSPVLHSERLDLRELGLDDADFMLELLNDEDFVRNIGDRGVRTLDDARQYIAAGSMPSYRQHGFGFWCVVHRDTYQRIGICGLARREELDAVDIGYAFLPAWRGKGFALEAASTVMDAARQRFCLRRIVAITSLDNPASARLLERIGLTFERRIQMDDEDLRLFAWNAPT
ncbi:GNAT family N-acetyltransferase [Dokdonella sp.]|uniref:GNAT family N-acetyltransferase n=1 Tax=Dokdonella sp. TaxID=2291710 RepID=UPI003C45BEED